jgi:S1-C subfamily serine protease
MRWCAPQALVFLAAASAFLDSRYFAVRVTDNDYDYGSHEESEKEEDEDGYGQHVAAASLAEVDQKPFSVHGNPDPGANIGREPGDFRHRRDHGDSSSFVSATEWEAEHARAALIRITTSVHAAPVGSLNSFIYQPWSKACMTSSTSIGSGWIVSSDPIVIVTNSHVVRDGVSIWLQLPILGKDHFEGNVRMISRAYDLAFVTFVDEAKFLKAVRAAGIITTTLRLANVSCPFGAEVLAVGFSLGGSYAKVSKGIISGSKTIKSLELGAADNVCQTTAPISPGNSGGPLIYVDSNLTVAGVIFAAEMTGQNNNYVVPGFRVRQLLAKLIVGENQEASIYPVV